MIIQLNPTALAIAATAARDAAHDRAAKAEERLLTNPLSSFTVKEGRIAELRASELADIAAKKSVLSVSLNEADFAIIAPYLE